MSMLEVNGLMLKETVSVGALQSAIPTSITLAALPAQMVLRVVVEDDGRVVAQGNNVALTLGFAEVA